MRLLSKGAEANLYLADWYGRKSIIKVRVAKKYRVKEMDGRIRGYRTLHEAQMLHEAKRTGVSTPILYQLDRNKFSITMEYVEGTRLKEGFYALTPARRSSLCRELGRRISFLHRHGIIHGDLTTSNLILTDDEKIYFIDFGLSYYSQEIEDKGVDLHLIKRALNSSHYEFAENAYADIQKGYEEACGRGESTVVVEKVDEIERRGRYFSRDRRRPLKGKSKPKVMRS